MRRLIGLASAAVIAGVAIAQAQTPSGEQTSPSRPQAVQPAPCTPPPGGHAVGTTGDATSGSGAVRRQAIPPNGSIAPGTGGGRENQVPQMDRQ
jgi:hypothetical protein